MQQFKGAFWLNDIDTDLLTKVFGISLVTPVTAKDYIALNFGNWWAEKDCNGNIALCSYCTLFSSNEIELTDSNGANPYTLQPIEFIGGHPSHPHPKPNK